MRSTPAWTLLVLALVSCGGGSSAPPNPSASAPAGTIIEYTVPTANSGVSTIAAGPDGALWFVESQAGEVGRITTAGSFTEYPLPPGVASPDAITLGPDKNLWLTDKANHLLRVTTGGAATLYTAPAQLGNIAVGADGNLWSPEYTTNVLDAFSTGGALLYHYATGYNNQNAYIALGSDNNLWIAGNSPTLARATNDGDFMTFLLAPPMAAGSSMRNLNNGPDGNLWICDVTDDLILKVSTDGVVLESYPVPTANAHPSDITTGPDGDLWFTEQTGNKIGRITTSGAITEYPVPTANAQPYWIVTGPDGNLWFTEANGNKVASIVP
jgi:streptogramin lyase